MSRENLVVETANQIRVEYDNQVVGMVQSVDCNEDYGLEPASGIGDIHVQENVPSMARYTVSISSMVLRLKSLRALGILPLDGDDVLKGRVFDICIYAKDAAAGSKPLVTYKDVSIGSAGTQINKHAIVMSNATGSCLRVIRGDKARGL